LLARGTLSGGGGATRRRREASDAFMDGRPSDDVSTTEGEGSPTAGGGGAMVEVTPHGAQGGAPSVAGAAAEGGELAEARP
jgi:hypothetical protein